MADGARIEDIEAIGELDAYLSRFREELLAVCDGISVEFQRVHRALFQEAVAYWRIELFRAEQRVVEARDALMMCRAKVRAEDHEACSEQQKQFDRAKARQRLCEEKMKRLQVCQREWDHFANQSLPRVAEANDLVETGIPLARTELRNILDLLDKYRTG
jgi:hypothetical protein